RSAYARVVLVLFGVLPGLHLVGLWDSYLSAALYSGNTLEGHVRVRPEHVRRLPADVQADLELGDGTYDLNVARWSMRALNVPAYPARHVYLHVAGVLADRSEPPTDLVLVISEQPDWSTGERRETTFPVTPTLPSGPRRRTSVPSRPSCGCRRPRRRARGR